MCTNAFAATGTTGHQFHRNVLSGKSRTQGARCKVSTGQIIRMRIFHTGEIDPGARINRRIHETRP